MPRYSVFVIVCLMSLISCNTDDPVSIDDDDPTSPTIGEISNITHESARVDITPIDNQASNSSYQIGVCVSTNSNPEPERTELSANCKEFTMDEFHSDFIDLEPATKYYVTPWVSFLDSDSGVEKTIYGSQEVFTTLEVPECVITEMGATFWENGTRFYFDYDDLSRLDNFTFEIKNGSCQTPGFVCQSRSFEYEYLENVIRIKEVEISHENIYEANFENNKIVSLVQGGKEIQNFLYPDENTISQVFVDLNEGGIDFDSVAYSVDNDGNIHQFTTYQYNDSDGTYAAVDLYEMTYDETNNPVQGMPFNLHPGHSAYTFAFLHWFNLNSYSSISLNGVQMWMYENQTDSNGNTIRGTFFRYSYCD